MGHVYAAGQGLDGVDLAVGFLAPVAIAVVQRPGWADFWRSLVALGCCLAAAAATAAATGGLGLDGELLTTTGTVLVTSQATYLGFWKNTVLVPWLEHFTTFYRPPPA